MLTSLFMNEKMLLFFYFSKFAYMMPFRRTKKSLDFLLHVIMYIIKVIDF